MGKGFNNFMCKKFFHPASRDNLKRVWIAEQKASAEKVKQEELRNQYEKEQELYNNKALLAKSETRDKLSLNFMYEAPAGVRKEREREDGEPEYKFEWQRKFKGPRESYCKDDDTIRDQPFGIAVRNVRCIKCKAWGHINTDKECPLYGRVLEPSEAQQESDINELTAGMRDDGLKLKTLASMTTGIYGNRQNPYALNQRYLSSDEESVDEMTLLKTLSSKDKKRLLKKLEKMDKKSKDKKDKKKKKKRKKSVSSSSSSDSSSESESENEKSKKKRKKKKKKNKKQKRKHKESSSSDSSDSEEEKTKKKKKKNIKQDEEENDPQQLLKEITKGLNIDFVGGGSSNPFAMGNVKVKKEKLSDDENDRRKSSKELRNGSHENNRREIKQEKEDLNNKKERNERESRDRNRERDSNQDQRYKEDRCGITDKIREIRDMVSDQNNANIKSGNYDRMEIRRDKSRDRKQRSRSQSRDRRSKSHSRSRDRRNGSCSRNGDKRNRSRSMSRNRRRSRSGSVRLEKRNRNRSVSKEHGHRSKSKERKYRSRSHSRERRHKSKSRSRDRR